MKVQIETVLSEMFKNANPSINSLMLRIECPFDSGIGVRCEGKSSSGLVYPEPDMDALSNYIDELRIDHPNDRFNLVSIRMTSPTDIVIERSFDEAFQREAEEMVHG